MISKSVTSLTLLCLIGMLASPIDALELESSVLDSQRGLKGPKGVKAPKNGKTGKKNPPMPTTPIPTSVPVPDPTVAPKDKKAKKDKQAKNGKTTKKKKDEKTDAPVVVNAAFEMTLPLCGICDLDAATKLGASQEFISEMQTIVAASLDGSVDPTSIDVTVDPDSEMCAGGPCGDTRNLSSVSRDLVETTISSVVITIVTPDANTDKVEAQNNLQTADYGKVGEIIITIVGPSFTTSPPEVKVISPEPSASSAPAATPLIRSRYLGFIN